MSAGLCTNCQLILSFIWKYKGPRMFKKFFKNIKLGDWNYLISGISDQNGIELASRQINESFERTKFRNKPTCR